MWISKSLNLNLIYHMEELPNRAFDPWKSERCAFVWRTFLQAYRNLDLSIGITNVLAENHMSGGLNKNAPTLTVFKDTRYI